MTDERRKMRRADIPGMRVIFEGAAGQRVEAEVLNVGTGGLFIRTEQPLAVGKRLSLEVQAVADAAAWSALGRVVWTRETRTAVAAPGMGVKLIDVEDAAVATIAFLVDDRAPRPPGPGPGKAPARERTVIGLGLSPTPAPAAPIIQAAPVRERTVLGIGAAGRDVPDVHEAATKETVVPQVVVRRVVELPRAEPVPAPQPPPVVASEPSVAIDLVHKKHTLPSEDSLEPAGVPRRRGGLWLLSFLLLLALAAGALYLMRDRVPWVQRLGIPWIR